MRREPEGEAHHRILHVESVVDELDGDARIFHRSRNRTGFAVMQAVHRVEHVGHDARARVEAGFGGLVVGVAVAHGRHHAGSGELADGGDAVGQFGGDGDLADAAKLAGGGVGTGGIKHLIDDVRHRILETFRVMCAFARQGQERAFQMAA